MADDEDSHTLTNLKHPRVIFIRQGKDKTKDAIQNKVFNGVRKALRDLGDNESASKQDVLVLPSIDARGICDVAIGLEYVGLLLKDGRVCRFKCVCKNFKPSSKGKNLTGSEEPIFQVQSDEAYARRLQEQLNTRNLTSSTFGDLNSSGVSPFGLAQPPFRFGALSGESGVSSDPFFNFPESTFENILPETQQSGSNEAQSSEDQAKVSKDSNSRVKSDVQGTSTEESSKSTNLDISSNSKSTSAVGNSQSSTPKSSNETSSSSENLNSRSDSSLYKNTASEPTVVGSMTETRRSNNITNLPNGRENLSRRPPPSPTVVHRTILTADPLLLRTSRPYYVPSHILIPSYPQISTPLYSFEPRRLGSSFSSRNQLRVIQRSGRRQFGSSYDTRRNRERESNASRREVGNNTEQASEDSTSDFNYPDMGELEWLQTETGDDIQFSQIAALHTDFILVEKDTGRLYHWPYKQEMPSSVSMETNTSSNVFQETPSADIPKAKVSPLIQELHLEEEQVTLLAANGIRCTLVTKSGKIGTFYDKFFRESNNDEEPALIQQLSHSAVVFPELKGDIITAVDCSEFFSSVMTQSGKIFWWGLLPSEERQDFKQKQSKESNNICNISVNDKVQLRKHLPGFPGALVYKSSDTHGPQLGRLLSHETEGASQNAVKIKVEKIPKATESQSSSGSASPVASVLSKLDTPLAKGAASPMHLISQETRSASPHTNIKSLETRSNPNIEVWDVNDVVFLETESKVLGTVAAVDGPHVIVKVDNASITSDTALRVFKVSELETVSDDSASIHGASTSAIVSSTTMYRGCIQSAPKCILDATQPPSASDKEVLTGVRPVAMATTSSGISVLTEHKESRRAMFIGPVIDSGNSEKVFTCSEDMLTTRGNDDSCTTVDSESIPISESALNSVSVRPDPIKIGQKRKHHESDDDNLSLNEELSGHNMTPSRVTTSCTRIPSLHTSMGSNLILLCDNNGCLYPRPFGTKLSEPCAVELPPLHCLGVSQRIGFTSKCDAEEKILMVFLAFREQKLITAIQSGVVSQVDDVLNTLELLCLKNHKGKSTIRNKRIAQEGDIGKAWSSRTAEAENPDKGGSPVFSQEVLSIINERKSSNQNVVHVCCTNPSYLHHSAQSKEPVARLLAELEPTDPSSVNDVDKPVCVEVAVLDKLLNHGVFACKFVPMLRDRDAKGCTPFMLSIQTHNFKASLYILDFVVKNEGKLYGDCQVSMDTMIFPSTFSNITPLHALAIACTSNLPASGIGNSLTVANLPSGYTPRMLLKLFQANYPSAYRATIPPLVEAKKYPKAKTPRQRLLERAHKEKESSSSKMQPEPKKATLAPASTAPSLTASRTGPGRFGEGGNRIPVVGSRRESLQGMVTFSDPKELRQALIEMDKHMVSSETLAPEGGLANLVQHVLHVKLTELDIEENDKHEMEVGIRGDVYNVSTSSGSTKISRKPQIIDINKEKELSVEDDLICQLFAQLLSYEKIATANNQQDETVLSFFVNNSRWIKATSHQKERLLKYSNKLFGSQPEEGQKPNPGEQRNKASNDITAEIKIKGSSGSSATIESNLLAQLDEISSSFRSLVDTLAALEGRVSDTENEEQSIDGIKETKTDKTPTEGATVNTRNLIDLTSATPAENAPLKDKDIPILIQLAQNWPCVAATVLGYFPKVTEECPMEGLESTPIKDQKGITSESKRAPRKGTPGSSCSIDGFVIELLTNADKAVLVTFVETIINEMNKYPTELLLDATRQNFDPERPFTPGGLAVAVGMKFLRAVIRQMSVHLSRSGVSYIDLRSRLGATSQTSSNISFGSDQNQNVEFKQKVRMILKSFSWLGIYELVQAAEATILPVREGVAKAQAKSTRASISNNIPTPNVFPGGRYRGGRPGIRVSQYDSRSSPQEAMLRTAFRLPDVAQSSPVVLCRGTRLSAFTEDGSSPRKRTSTPPLSLRGHTRANIRRTSVMDSDSDSDEETGSLFRNVLDEDSDMDLEESDPSSVAMATGLSRDHPYAWALDGRLSGTGENSSSNSVQAIGLTHYYINNINAPPSVHTGNCYLTRMYSRLVKEAVDVMLSIKPHDPNSSKEPVLPEEPVLPVLGISSEECCSIQDSVTAILNVTWVWLAKVLDVVEGQLQRGKGFDTKRYLASLQRPDDGDFSPLPRSSSTIPGASPEEYLMFLLRSHTNEHSDTLPVIDMLCYEHMVYILDSFLYCTERCTKPEQILNRSRSSISSLEGDESTGVHSADINRVHNEPGTSSQSNPRRIRNKEREELVKFFGTNVAGKNQDEFLQHLQATLQQKTRMLVPKATWEVFTHNVGTLRMKSVDESSSKTGIAEESELPVTIESASKITYPSPLTQNWSADHIFERWKISIDLFSRLFLADGPGAERDSFLAARAGVAGRLARFRRTMLYLRESVTADSQQGGLGFGGLGGRVGTTLSIAVKRTRLLEDTLRILGEMQPFHYSNFRAKFEGEEGSGPGVNRGFFAAVANALKADNKLPPEATALLHEPGKLPEQSGFYAPKPWSYREGTKNGPQIKSRRLKMFTAIGRFLGLSLWFNNTVPLNFSRHVIKYLLDRDVTWEDLIFFNADLFEGLSRMIIDAAHPLMTSERFQATYCCHFETSVGGTTEELLPGGSQLPVTPENIYKYVRLYASKVMTGCVEEELRSIRNGLHDVIPSELLTTLSPEDFQLLLSGGTTDIDISKLRSLITFTNSNGCSKDILERFKRWFWSIVQKMTPLQRQQLLYFCTGSAVLPVMNDRRDPEQDLSITIDVISGNTKALPMATTCGQRMSIPLYPSKRILKKKLLQAIQCQSYGLG